MVKGVNRRIVEVSLPDSEIFEKAVVFLRPDSTPPSGNDLGRKAGESISALESGFSSASSGHTVPRSPKKGLHPLFFLRAAVFLTVIGLALCGAAVLFF